LKDKKRLYTSGEIKNKMAELDNAASREKDAL